MAKNFTLPSPKKLKDIGRELKLNDAQARELEFVIRHAHADLDGFLRTRMTRADRGRRLKQLKTFRGGGLVTFQVQSAILGKNKYGMKCDSLQQT